MLENLNDIIEPEKAFVFDEAKKGDVVDGQHVLARVKGQFFVPDGQSRNGRFYPKSLWERIISDPSIKRRLAKKIMFGTIGHDGELSEKAIREGMISHIVIDIGIDENNKGMGEALILNTPAGRILNVVLRAGSELAVSSRANGTFKGKKNGIPVVDEETYDLDGWDFVIDPGFLEAQPEITESLQDLYKQYNIKEQNEGEDPMSEKTVDKTLVEHIANENADLKNKVGAQADEIESLKEDSKTISEENANLKVELEKMETIVKANEAFSEIGTVEEIQEKLKLAEEAQKELAEFKELADTPAETKTALEESLKYIEAIKEAFGGLEAAKTAKEALAKFEELGSYEAVEGALLKFKAFIDEKAEKEKAASIDKLAEELNFDKEKVKGLLEKYSEEDVRALYEQVKPASDDSSKYKKTKVDETNTKPNIDAPETPVKKSLAEKIGESLTGN